MTGKAVILVLALSVWLEAVSPALAAKVFVVMSYSESNASEIEIRRGIEEVLTGADLRYFYMDTKRFPRQGRKKAAEAAGVFRRFEPDVVIAADDNAQSMFVLPYVKDHTGVPVVFCGVNDEAGKYGYPNDQVTGILEKKHYRQSISFARQLEPRLQRLAVIYKENASNRTNLAQIRGERESYGVTVDRFEEIYDRQDLLDTLAVLEEEVDALLVLNLSGIGDGRGGAMGQKEALKLVAERWPKVSIGASKKEIKYGLLCAIAKINREQGLVAGRFADQILKGVPVRDIPVTENRNGQRVINVKTAKRIGLRIKPMFLIGTDLLTD